jgi:peroxiredoxin Q/BCP
MKAGSQIPRLSLPDRADRSVALFEKGDDFTILYFYPKDDTPGCTLEAQGFNRLLPLFLKRRARIVGISGGDARSKEKFCKKFGLEITLLSDTDFSLSKRLGAYGRKVFMGREYLGVLRKTFIFDGSGKLIKSYDTVKPEEHPEEVLKFIESVATKGGSTSSRKASAKPTAPTAGKKKTPAAKPAKKAASKGIKKPGKAAAKKKRPSQAKSSRKG